MVTTPTQLNSPSQRVVFLDVARAYACVMMVFGHTVESTLMASSRYGPLFTQWDHWRGLTAPLFLFVSGFAFYIATTRYWDDYLKWSPRPFRRLRRALFLLAIGYLLQLPVSNPIHLFKYELSTKGWMAWMRVDILHCIGMNLLLLHLIIFLIRHQRRFLFLLSLAMPLVFLLSPFIWFLNGTVENPSFWNFYLGGNFRSQFPMIPWVGFMYGGILMGYWYWNHFKKNRAWPLYMMAAGLAIFLFGLYVESVYGGLPAEFTFRSLQAQTLWIRFSLVIIITAGIAMVVYRLKSVPYLVSLLGRETLTIYWMHLAVVYGSPWNLGLSRTYGRTLPLWQSVSIFGVLFSVLTLIVLVKDWLLRRDYRKIFRRVRDWFSNRFLKRTR